jgi:hypothetical protein
MQVVLGVQLVLQVPETMEAMMEETMEAMTAAVRNPTFGVCG